MNAGEKKAALQRILYREALDELHGLFRAWNLPYMPVKSALYLLDGTIDSLTPRSISDLDVLVAPPDFETAVRRFQETGNVAGPVRITSIQATLRYRFHGLDIEIDVHRALNHPQRFHLPVETLFSRARPCAVPRFLPDAEDALLISACHLLAHVVEHGIPPFRCEELRVLSGARGFSWDTFARRVRQTGVERFLCFCLRHARALPEGTALSDRTYPYARLLERLYPLLYSGYVPALIKRLLVEAYFVKNPLALLHRRFCSRDGSATPSSSD